MRDDVIISHRGSRYEIGRGPGCYAIWPAGAAHLQPIEWWPETEAGWQDAWARFTDIESRRSITEVPAASGQVVLAPSGSAPAARPGGSGYGPGADVTVADAQIPGATVPGADANVADAQRSGSAVHDAAVPWPSISGSAVPGPSATGSAGPGGTDPAAANGAIPAWAAAGLTATTLPPPGASPDRPAGPAARFGRGGRRAVVAAGLLGLGVILGIAALFPGYFGSSSLASDSSELVPHLIYLAAWTAAAVLIVMGGARQRTGALLAAGVSVVTFGLFIADTGTAASGGASLIGAGLIVSMVGWAACTAGAVVALVRGGAGRPARPRGTDMVVHLAVGLVAAIGAAIAFAPSWDRFTLRTSAGASLSITEGYAFSNPGLAIAGDVVVMAALVAVVLVATLWRPVRFGAALLAGASVPMAAQAISALIQIREPVSPYQFGLTPAQAAAIGAHITAGLTPAFWIYCAFVLGLLLTWSLMLATPAPAPPAPRPAYSQAGSGSYGPPGPFDAASSPAT